MYKCAGIDLSYFREKQKKLSTQNCTDQNTHRINIYTSFMFMEDFFIENDPNKIHRRFHQFYLMIEFFCT